MVGLEILRRSLVTRAALISVISLAGVSTSLSANTTTADFRSSFCKATVSGGGGKNMKSIITAQNKFTFATLSHHARSNEGKTRNLVLAPFSGHSVLSMALVGARGKTRTDLATALQLDPRYVAREVEWLGDRQAVTKTERCSPTGDGWTTDVRINNRVYVQTGKKLNAEMTKRVETAFDAGFESLDFRRQLEPSRVHINTWVKEQTAGEISELIGRNVLKSDTRLVLVNTALLEAPWALPFPKGATKDKPFNLASDPREPKKMVNVSTMQVTGQVTSFRYAKRRGFALASMPVQDHQLEMVIVLPDAMSRLDTVLSELAAGEFEASLAARESRRLVVSLPKFKFSSNADFGEIVAKLGGASALKPGADFTGIDDGKDQLFIGPIVHQAKIDVHEDGFKAAAATAVAMMSGGAPPKPEDPIPFVVDRPFLFFIVHRETNAVWFAGVVRDPRA